MTTDTDAQNTINLSKRNTLKAALLTGFGVQLSAVNVSIDAADASDSCVSKSAINNQHALATMDMVHSNPGAEEPDTQYIKPEFLAARHYDATVIEHAIEGVVLFKTLYPDLFTSKSGEWRQAEQLIQIIGQRITAAKANGLQVYAWTQFVVLPKKLLDKYGSSLVDELGRIDVTRRETQHVLSVFVAEIFSTFPELDGLIVRTGEVYLHDLPYHDSRLAKNIGKSDRLIQASTAITQGQKSHRALIKLLRDEVCVKANKKLFYRTWDFGNNFHTNPSYYLAVTNTIPPHKNLFFSIKHQAGDFHRLTPFNPTLGIGIHQQNIEVQCQLEAYGKGAHPYYVAQAVIEGWEEYQWQMPTEAVRGLKDITPNPLIKSLWTWSRGGGWDGPYIQHEIWCDLNAYVLMKYAQNPKLSEELLFAQYAHEILQLDQADTQLLRTISIDSAAAVLRGQLTNLGADIYLWWARDDTLGEPNLDDFIDKGLIDDAIAEKQQAIELWLTIESNMRKIRFATPQIQAFAECSASYGHYKYSLIGAGWTALLLAGDTKKNGKNHTKKIKQSIVLFETVWAEWQAFANSNPSCPTLPSLMARSNKPGLGAAIERLRKEFL